MLVYLTANEAEADQLVQLQMTIKTQQCHRVSVSTTSLEMALANKSLNFSKICRYLQKLRQV